MSKCAKCETTGIVGYICDRCHINELEGQLENCQDDNVDKEKRIAELELSNEQYLSVLTSTQAECIEEKRKRGELETELTASQSESKDLMEKLKAIKGYYEAELAKYMAESEGEYDN